MVSGHQQMTPFTHHEGREAPGGETPNFIKLFSRDGFDHGQSLLVHNPDHHRIQLSLSVVNWGCYVR